MISLRLLTLLSFGLGLACAGDLDVDRDGLPDRLEQALLSRFVPSFHVSAADCDVAPAEFEPGLREPKVKARNGTISGQVFPVKRVDVAGEFIEIHYYHLWGRDCGRTGHRLDAEHVSVLLRADGHEWRPQFWYAAAHESTLCDMGTGAAASALGALDHGPDIWVSRDKHASFLRKDLCAGGCGGDVCDDAPVLRVANLINLGEPGAPMNGSEWISSRSWSVQSKMVPDFTNGLIARMPAGNDAGLVPKREMSGGVRGTAARAAKTYVSVASATESAGSGIAAGTRGADAGMQAAGASIDSSANRADQSLGSASSSAWGSLKRAFRSLAKKLHLQGSPTQPPPSPTRP